MATEIRDAIARLEQRKEASGLGEMANLSPANSEDVEAAARRALSGLDLDIEELEAAMQEKQKLALVACVFGAGPGAVASATFVEGIAVGLLIAEARQREEARRKAAEK